MCASVLADQYHLCLHYRLSETFFPLIVALSPSLCGSRLCRSFVSMLLLQTSRIYLSAFRTVHFGYLQTEMMEIIRQTPWEWEIT